jgi:hypothetical protein
VLDEFKEWVKGLIRTEAQPPLWLAFPSDPPDSRNSRLVPNADYFRVRIHRIHLTYEQQWFEKFSPMLLIATEFSYDGTDITRPSVIGPSMIEQLGRAAPVSSIIAGSIVAGPHPLRDVSLTVTVALHRIARSDNVGDFLKVVEGTARALDLVTGLTPYTALARTVVTGLTALTGGDRPLIARRDEFSPVLASYYALISPTSGVNPQSLVINNGDLSQRVNGQLRPFRSADYVTYSVDRVGIEDVDVTRLPLYRQWLTVLGEATQADTPQVWKSAKANLSSLITMAFTSPDLTYGHAEALEQEWITKAVGRRDRARMRGDMGGQTHVLDDVRSRALAVLEL